MQVTASDWDEGDNGLVVYSIPGNVGRLFYIDQQGTLSVHTAVDREAYDTFRFPVLAVDSGSPALTGSALIVISVEDVDDEQPHFVQQEFHFDVVENEAPSGAQVGFVLAEDRDGAPYNTFVYAFHSGDQISEAAFNVDSDTGAVTLRHSLDRERRAQHQFVVVAYDPKSPESSGTAAVIVDVIDRNDNAPVFTDTGTIGNDSVLQVSSLTPPGHVIAIVPATDADDGENARLTYLLSADDSSDDVTRLFRIDARRGAVSIKSTLSSGFYRLPIIVADRGSPSLSTSTVLTVYVNESLPFQQLSSAASTSPYNGDSGGISLSSTSAFNLVLLVAVVCGCAVVIFILVVVIALVRHRDRRHHARKYNCRMEALRVITSGGADAPEVASEQLSNIAVKSTSTTTKPVHNGGLRTTTTFPVHEVNQVQLSLCL